MSNDTEYTTVALTPEDKARLDRIKATYLDDDAASYREVINFLADEVENYADEYEAVLARAIIRASDDDMQRVRERVRNDTQFVERVASQRDDEQEE